MKENFDLLYLRVSDVLKNLDKKILVKLLTLLMVILYVQALVDL